MAKRKSSDGLLGRFNGTNPHISVSLSSPLPAKILAFAIDIQRTPLLCLPVLPLVLRLPPHSARRPLSLLPPLARRVRDTPTGAGDSGETPTSNQCTLVRLGKPAGLPIVLPPALRIPL